MNDSRQIAGTVAVPRQPAETPTPKTRDAFFDNAKYFAIVLVAMGHAWEPLRDSRAVLALYMTMYAFHMPAFIIISGYLSRNFDGRADRVQRLVTGVVVPYVIFQIAYTLYIRRVGGNDNTYLAMFEPRWLMWFLLALLIWRLTIPLWKAVRWPVPLALCVAAVACMQPSLSDDLQIQRVLQFMPFFVLGLVLKPEHFRLARHRIARLAALPVLAVTAVAAYWAVPRGMRYTWFYHRESAQELGQPWWMGIVATGLIFLVSVILTVCFFALVPGKHRWFTKLGAGTLYGYLLHGFLIRGAQGLDLYDADVMNDQPGALVIATLAAVIGMTLLCTPLVQRVFRPLMEPRMNWLFRRTERPTPATPR
ncbi:acyltransferase family protein [Streptomyces sp. NPDC049881]|uniref:acyltransferase family protein n=1 Tax=unclassified Streptomyces TaxID=2593676 RepID=UPI00342E7F5F